MIAPVLAVALCLSVCPSASVCHKSELYRNSWTDELVFGIGASIHLSYIVLKGKSGIFKNKGTGYFRLELCPKLRT